MPTATISASTIQFQGGTISTETWSYPSRSGPITIVPGSGGYFQIGSGQPVTLPSAGFNYSCSGTGCLGTSAASMTGKASGIFFGPVGDHAGVALGGVAYGSNGQTIGNFGTVRVYCPSGC